MSALWSRIIAHFVVLTYHTRFHAPTYSSKFYKSSACLLIHIGTGMFDSFRYHIVTSQASNLVPTIVDVASCMAWSWTSIVLVKTLRRGHPRTTRPVYQAAAVLRPVATFISYLVGIHSLHKASVYALDGFVYTRLFIFFFSYTPYLQGTATPSTVYAISLPLAAVFSVHESRVPYASLVFVLVTAYITQLNQWVTYKSRQLEKSSVSWQKIFVEVLVRLGFVELERLREISEERALQSSLRDDYVSKSLS